MSYESFKGTKRVSHGSSGFATGDLPDWLKPFQKEIVRRACEAGRFAVFSDTGTGKTRIQLCIAELCAKRTGKPSLILAPLAVTGQTIEEGLSLGVDVAEVGEGESLVQVVNYDQLKNVDHLRYGCVLLDESSILKNLQGAMRGRLVESFSSTPYRFCLTATPAPNDHTELGNHAEFLGVMGMQSMLSRWFVHDSMNTSEWRLKNHAVDDFWEWVASWAVALRKPSDLKGFGFSDEGYVLPPLILKREIVGTDPIEGGTLVHDSRLSATTLHVEMRRTAKARAERVAEIIAAEPDERWLIWCNTDYEATELRVAIPGVVEVSGSMHEKAKKSLLLGFGHGSIPLMLTKSKIAGFGMNWQVCTRTVFVGSSYSYESVYQCLRRFWRYGQTKEVRAYLVSADTEWSVLESVDRKASDHERMVAEMVARMGKGKAAQDVEGFGDDSSGNGWSLLRGDCVERIKDVPSDSVGFSIFSPPFASLYTYSDLCEDMGNCSSDQEFFAHFEFLVPELFRVLKPGRLISMHCMDLPSTKERDGVIGLRDFPGELIRLFERHGFIYHSRVTIWKDPLVAMQRTKALGLIHKQLVKDSAMSRQGIADYVVTLRKPGENLDPIVHGFGLSDYVGIDDPGGEVTDDPKTNKRSHYVWQRYASPVWMDIDPGHVLRFQGARAEKDERHICPLQLQVIERCVELWSNPGDTVLDPFNGIGSTGFVSVGMGRDYVGIELKESYFAQAVLNLARAKSSVQTGLFDSLEVAS